MERKFCHTTTIIIRYHFIEWNSRKQLKLDPEFQCGSVWSDAAKVYLIDTILKDLPIPQVYFRTKLDTLTQSTVREIVDGQQRLRAILSFADNKIRLTSKSPDFNGETYKTLPDDVKTRFLSYRIPVVQLINVSDSDVLEVFARLNSYSVKVTPAELRHAEYSEPVNWAVYDTARAWSELWTEYKILSTRETVRLKNNSLIAEMFMALEHGLERGGEPAISKYYNKSKQNSDTEFYCETLRENFDKILSKIIEELGDEFKDTTFFHAPNFLLLFCAVGFLSGILPSSKATEEFSKLRGLGLIGRMQNIGWGTWQKALMITVQRRMSSMISLTPLNQRRMVLHRGSLDLGF